MKNLLDQLANYASHHRDPRNRAAHWVGVPMIVLSVLVLLARVVWVGQPLVLGAAELVTALVLLYFLRLDLGLGALAALMALALLWVARTVADQSQTVWLMWGLGLSACGWALVFLGHYWEDHRPAFVDDVSSLIIAPLFIVAGIVFALGGRHELRQAIADRVGAAPRRRRSTAAT